MLRRVVPSDTIVLLSSHIASDVAMADAVHLVKHGSLFWSGDARSFLRFSPDADFDSAFVAAFTT